MKREPVQYEVPERCIAESGDCIEAGRYSGTKNERRDMNAKGGMGPPTYILERPGLFPVVVNSLIEQGKIRVIEG